MQEEEAVKVARYFGGLRGNIQEEISLWEPTTMQKCFQLALKVEEKNMRKEEANSKIEAEAKKFIEEDIREETMSLGLKKTPNQWRKVTTITITKEATREVL